MKKIIFIALFSAIVGCQCLVGAQIIRRQHTSNWKVTPA